ncbi:uncharacterized protein TNCV_2565111 [Trichonephila clavipes]|uniref:Uncharacterized protein n=1 Tax=Trichonephila clavipes TaxID=2585209 RepID=A0A8X6SFG3_TRICX|nr:uncharacterized protein TNCV_2565111 [Trichonephila clavipes]
MHQRSLTKNCWYLLLEDFVSNDQYGLTPHQSNEDALLSLNEIVQRSAFDNACWPYILNLPKKVDIPKNIVSLVADFLNDRMAKMELNSTSEIQCLERGCPQSSVSGPIVLEYHYE